jgi:hypothetical protein
MNTYMVPMPGPEDKEQPDAAQAEHGAKGRLQPGAQAAGPAAGPGG